MKNVNNHKTIPKKFYKDDEGIIYKHPERTCKNCIKYPCFKGIENFVCDMAKYGCIEYKDK